MESSGRACSVSQWQYRCYMHFNHIKGEWVKFSSSFKLQSHCHPHQLWTSWTELYITMSESESDLSHLAMDWDLDMGFRIPPLPHHPWNMSDADDPQGRTRMVPSTSLTGTLQAIVMVWPLLLPFLSPSSSIPCPSPPSPTSNSIWSHPLALCPLHANSKAYPCNYTTSTVRLAPD